MEMSNKKNLEEIYYTDYPTEPIGDGNPYYRCVYCKISDPQINGRLEGHSAYCEWRKKKEEELRGEKKMSGDKEEFYFFWKHKIGQWHIRDFVVDGITYNCCEQFMMAEKARIFKDEATRKKIMAESSPRDQKALGREVKGFKDGVWNGHREDVVYRGNYAKFTQNPDLKEILLATGTKTLVEASPYDKIWGIGMDSSDPKAKDRSTWRGLNLLGKVLTKLRNDLRQEELNHEDKRNI